MVRFTTVDAHCGGAPLRLIVGGAPTPVGATMREKTEWLAHHADAMRRTVMLEPRGQRDLTGAMLTEPVTRDADAGIVFMNADGYVDFAGHTVMAATLVALDRGLVVPPERPRTTPAGARQEVVYDTVAGLVRAGRPAGPGPDGSSVVLSNVPSFVLRAGLPIRLGGHHVRVDVAFGGMFYAIVDAESAGVGVDRRHLPQLRRLGRDIVRAVDAALDVVHPGDASCRGVSGTLFTGPSESGAHLRGVTVLAAGGAGRAPSASGMSAVMAVLSEMELLDGEDVFRQEGLSGAVFTGRIVDRGQVADYPAIMPAIMGAAWVTGEHTLLADAADPFATGLPDLVE